MMELGKTLFGFVCGQNLAHTWSPGGLALPFCQRCAGLYVGAFMAAFLHLALRPQATYRWRLWHGGFLLAMLPCGFHWIVQGPVLRTVTGVLFGFGLTAFLRLPLSRPAWTRELTRAKPIRPAGPTGLYVAGLLATLVFVPYLGAKGNARAAFTLTLLATGGALILFGLVLVHAGLALRWLLRRFLNRTLRVTP